MAQVSLDGVHEGHKIGESEDDEGEAVTRARREALATDLSRAILFTRAVTRAAAELGGDGGGQGERGDLPALNAFDKPALGLAPTAAKLREDIATESPGGEGGRDVLGQARKRVGQFFVVPKA